MNRPIRSLLACVGLTSCVGPTSDDPATVDTDRPGASDTDTDLGQDSDAGHDSDSDAAQDTDSAVATDPLPQLVWTELVSGIVAVKRCSITWTSDEGSGPALTRVHPFAGGWSVAGVDDPWFTVLVDVECDSDSDGTLDQRGLVLGYDPQSGTLVDQPLLPDDFVSLGLLTPETFNREIHALAVIDLDDDGQSEIATDSPSGSGQGGVDRVLRYSAAAGALDGLPDFQRGLALDVAGGGITSLGISDVDNDGLLDVQWLVNGRLNLPAQDPMVTLVQAGGGKWDYQSLYDPVAKWVPSSGVGTLWQQPGGLQIQITPADELVNCFAQKHDNSGAPLLSSAYYPLFGQCDPSWGGAQLSTPMGVAFVDLNEDGEMEVLISAEQGGSFPILGFRDFLGAQAFNYAELYTATLPDAINGSHHGIPWSPNGVDVDNDGHVDFVASMGEDVVPWWDAALCAQHPTCTGLQPIGVWHNPGTPSPTGAPDFAYVGLDHIQSNVPPILNVNGAEYVDMDRDGDLDFLFSGVDAGEHLLYRNDTELGQRFCLRGHGHTSNHLGVGSFVEVETPDGHVQHFQVGGESGLTVHTGTPEVCAGLGAYTSATVRWTWPSGYTQTVEGVPAGGAYTLDEPELFSILASDGHVLRPSAGRRNPNGASVRALVCAYSDAPVPFGQQPQRLATTPTVDVSKVSVGGTSTFYATPGPWPPGCIEFSAYTPGSRPSSTVYTITINGVELTTHPRLWWGD